MSRYASTWGTPVAVIVASFVLWIATARVTVRSAAVSPGTEVTAPEPTFREGEPPSNEIADFLQLD